MPQLHARTSVSKPSIFAYMSQLAAQHGAVNLGQGFPSNPPPEFLLEAARRAIGTVDQYTPPIGLPRLREALAEDLNVTPEQVVVTSGATESMHTLAESLYGAGDQVVMFEPYFDIYIPQTHMTGAEPVMVAMKLNQGWEADLEALEAAITPRARAIIVTTPYNPTGSVFSRSELERIVAIARQHDLWIISDEVYEELFFGAPPIHTRDLAPERTFTVGSAGKRLEATGWRVGWILCPPGLSPLVGGIRQWASFCSPAPLQAAIAEALPIARREDYYGELRQKYGRRVGLLASGLAQMGIQTFAPQGSYFLTARIPGLDAEVLVKEAKVALIPGSAFYIKHPTPEGLVRFAFCKKEDEIEQALERLGKYLKVMG
jgi:N-succinyldiaminopimelate aminotransferase